MTKHAVYVLSDTHINSTVALSHPESYKDDGGMYDLSKSQWWLYDNWKKHNSWVKRAIDGADCTTLILNGDILDLALKHKTHQIITTNPAVVLDNANLLLQPLCGMFDEIYGIRGTAAHVGESGAFEDILYSTLPKIVKSDTGSSAHWQIKKVFSGVRMDIAHHASFGMLPWTRPNAITKLAARAVLEYGNDGIELPHLLIRSHGHQMLDSYDAYKVRAITTPSWSLRTEHTWRLNIAQPLSTVGSIVIRCEDGRFEVLKDTYKIEEVPWN